MRTLCFALAVIGLALAGCGEKSEKSAAATNASTGGSSPLTAPSDYLGAMGKAKQNAVKTADLAPLNQAIQMYNTEHGKNPKDLNELVEEKYLPRIPEAPYGMKFQYDATTGRVSLTKQN